MTSFNPLINNFFIKHSFNPNLNTGFNSDSSSTTTDYVSNDSKESSEASTPRISSLENIDFSEPSGTKVLILDDNRILRRINNNDSSVVPTLKKMDVGLSTLLPNYESLGSKLCKEQSFLILNAMSEQNLLDLNFSVSKKPFWFYYLAKNKILQTHIPSNLDPTCKKILKTFLKSIADHLETIERFPVFTKHVRLIRFCLEQKKYHLLSKMILETGFCEKWLDTKEITRTLVNAFLDKRGDVRGKVDYKIIGSVPRFNAYMIMRALKKVSLDCQNENSNFNFLQPFCKQLLNSLGFRIAMTLIKGHANKSSYLLSALKTFNPFPLLLEIGTKTHSMTLGIDRNKDSQESYNLTIYNTGRGVKKHHQKINEKSLTFCSSEVTLTTKKLPWTQLFRRGTEVDEVYEKVENLIEEKEDLDFEDSVHCEAKQKLGSCSFQSSMAFIHHYFLENFPGSLEERKGAYKVFKALLLTSLFDVYITDADCAFYDLFELKYQIHKAELVLFTLAENQELCKSLFESFFHELDLIILPDFMKIKNRYMNLEVHTIYSNFYFLLRLTRYIAKSQDMDWCQNFSKSLNNEILDNLIKALHALKHSPSNY